MSDTADTPTAPAPVPLTADQKRTLAAVRKRIGASELEEVIVGLETLVTLGDTVLWKLLAEGTRYVADASPRVDPKARFEFDDAAEIPKRVKSAHRETVALYALRYAGALDTLAKLGVPPGAARLDPLAGLAALRELWVTTQDPTPLAGLALDFLAIRAVGPNLDLSPIAALSSLRTLSVHAPGPAVCFAERSG